jgi:hypothetical protein
MTEQEYLQAEIFDRAVGLSRERADWLRHANGPESPLPRRACLRQAKLCENSVVGLANWAEFMARRQQASLEAA